MGVPDASLGEEIYAGIIPVDGQVLQLKSCAILCFLICQGISSKYFDIVDSFPMTASGKYKNIKLGNRQ